jgi:hypothetical protein
MNPKQFLRQLYDDGLPDRFEIFGYQIRQWMDCEIDELIEDAVYDAVLCRIHPSKNMFGYEYQINHNGRILVLSSVMLITENAVGFEETVAEICFKQLVDAVALSGYH